jgi:hypothetical protein
MRKPATATHGNTIQKNGIDLSKDVVGAVGILKDRLDVLPVFPFLLLRPDITLLSLKVTSPSVGLINPSSILANVVLPLPDSPTIEMTSPSWKSKSTWSTATVLVRPKPNTLVRPLPLKHEPFSHGMLISLPQYLFR